MSAPYLPANRPGNEHLAYPDSPIESARKCLFWGWILVGGGCLLAFIPFLGILMWFIAAPLVLTGFVLAIVAITQGRTAGGICLLLFSIFVAPFTLILAPIVTSVLGIAASAPRSSQTNPLDTYDFSAGSPAPNTPTEAE